MIQNKGSPQTITWKDVNFWFKTQEGADQFVKAANYKLAPHFCPALDSAHDFSQSHSPIVRRQFELRWQMTNLVTIDVIVAAEFPVDDFDVNMLRATINNYGSLKLSEMPPLANETQSFALQNTIKSKIKAKSARMLPGYITNFTSTVPYRADHHARRVIDRYFNRGWEVTLPDGIPLNPDERSVATLVQFIRNWASNHWTPGPVSSVIPSVVLPTPAPAPAPAPAPSATPVPQHPQQRCPA